MAFTVIEPLALLTRLNTPEEFIVAIAVLLEDQFMDKPCAFPTVKVAEELTGVIPEITGGLNEGVKLPVLLLPQPKVTLQLIADSSDFAPIGLSVTVLPI